MKKVFPELFCVIMNNWHFSFETKDCLGFENSCESVSVDDCSVLKLVHVQAEYSKLLPVVNTFHSTADE